MWISFYISTHLNNCDFKNASLNFELGYWPDDLIYQLPSKNTYNIASIPKEFSSACSTDNQYLIEISESLKGINPYIHMNYYKINYSFARDMRSLYALIYIFR